MPSPNCTFLPQYSYNPNATLLFKETDFNITNAQTTAAASVVMSAFVQLANVGRNAEVLANNTACIEAGRTAALANTHDGSTLMVDIMHIVSNAASSTGSTQATLFEALGALSLPNNPYPECVLVDPTTLPLNTTGINTTALTEAVALLEASMPERLDFYGSKVEELVNQDRACATSLASVANSDLVNMVGTLFSAFAPNGFSAPEAPTAPEGEVPTPPEGETSTV